MLGLIKMVISMGLVLLPGQTGVPTRETGSKENNTAKENSLPPTKAPPKKASGRTANSWQAK